MCTAEQTKMMILLDFCIRMETNEEIIYLYAYFFEFIFFVC